MDSLIEETVTGHAPADGGLGQIPCTNDALRRATRQLGGLYDEAFAQTGLKATQLGLMFRIEAMRDDGGPTIQELAERLDVGISALTHALRPLARDGLVELRADAADRRSKRAVLTALGRARVQEGILLWSAANRRVEELLGPEAEKLRAIAERVSSEAFATEFRSGLKAGARR